MYLVIILSYLIYVNTSEHILYIEMNRNHAEIMLS